MTKYRKYYLPIIGFFALIWIAIRVIPKPSRASYPCMRAAYPVAFSFFAYLAGIGLSSLAFIKAKKWYGKKNYIIASICVVFGLVIPVFIHGDSEPAYAQYVTSVHTANQPMGVAKGISPGRVVWVHNPDAVTQDCDVSSWYDSTNINQTAVDQMLSSALQSVTDQTTDSAAWVAIFKYHNATRGKRTANYIKGEKIFIKINATSSYEYNSDLTPKSNVSETSVASVLAVLRQLVNVVGVEESDIYIGDPMKHIYKHLYTVWHGEFPHAHYLDNSYSTLGREKVVPSTTAIIHYSDHGTVLRNNDYNTPNSDEPIYSDYLYTILENAEYMINIPMLKGHMRAGITMFAKNHFGSQTGENAAHLHNGLVAPFEMSRGVTRSGYGLYRIQVDIMSHSMLGKKNLIYIMDALWATDWELDEPLKWEMPPFNTTYMSSVFVSLDPVAIESVGYDFLRSEFTSERHLRPDSAGTYVQMDGVDDYLHQAADSLNWPSGIKYDPDSTGVHIASLGVHEHWNNATDMKYSRNLSTGNGIELIKAPAVPTGVMASKNTLLSTFKLYENYPNPFNPTTTIRYHMPQATYMDLSIYNVQGKRIQTLVRAYQTGGDYDVQWNGKVNGITAASGVYFARLSAEGSQGTNAQVQRMLLMK